jgi:hypothetical protein
MALQQFFYDQQIRRYIIQFIRMVSNFQVEFGRDRNGVTALQRVPVIYGDSSRQAATIIKQNSENMMNAVPAMAVYIGAMEYDRDRMQNPTYVGKLNLRERYYDPHTGDYSTQQGDTFTVERLMPVPYKLTLKLDIWTSNTEQKLQLLEQICTLFNPALEIQSTDNYIDWTSLTYVLLTGVSWSSRTVPVNAETPIDIATLTFELPIYISSPALVKKLGVIQKIIANIFDANGNIDEAIYNEENLISRQYFTPLTYGVILLENTLRLVRYNSGVVDEFGQQIVKTLASNVTASTNFVLDNTDGIEPGMIVSGLDATGPGTISGNIRSNVITGVNTSFTSNIVAGTYLYYNSYALGYVTNVVSNTSVTLGSNVSVNISNAGYTYQNTITSGNTTVISTDGQSIVTSNIVTALSNSKIVFTAVTHKYGTEEPWRNLVNVYGNLVNGTSQVKLELADGNEIVGTVAYNPVDDTVLLYSPDIDTLPVNTIAPVNAIIDPLSSRPNKDLQSLVNSTRYLLVNDYYSAETGANAAVYNWTGDDGTPLRAYANDIIQYNGQHWYVAFSAADTPGVNYVTNMTTGTQYRWSGSSWAKSYEGYYPPGQWQLIV